MMSFLRKSSLVNNSSPSPVHQPLHQGRPLSNDQNPYLTLRPAGPPSLPLKQEEGEYNSSSSQHFLQHCLTNQCSAKICVKFVFV